MQWGCEHHHYTNQYKRYIGCKNCKKNPLFPITRGQHVIKAYPLHVKFLHEKSSTQWPLVCLESSRLGSPNGHNVKLQNATSIWRTWWRCGGEAVTSLFPTVLLWKNICLKKIQRKGTTNKDSSPKQTWYKRMKKQLWKSGGGGGD